MTRYLWTGESEFCICGHHITDHNSTSAHVLVCITGAAICRYQCKCSEFKPYRTRIISTGKEKEKEKEKGRGDNKTTA